MSNVENRGLSVAEIATEEVPHERMIVTLSGGGFIKRVPVSVYRSNKGIIGMVTRDSDAVKLLCEADTHETLLFFTNNGKVFSLKCREIPVVAFRKAQGTAITDFFNITQEERITALVSVTDFKAEYFLLMATEKGEIKKSSLKIFYSIQSIGAIAMDIEERDELVAAGLATDEDDVILITEQGQTIRFAVKSLRSSSRTSGGVDAIRLHEKDELVSMSMVVPETYLLVATVNGYGKLTPIGHYKRQNRGGVGIKTLKVTEITGKVSAANLVTKNQYLMLVSNDGMVISTRIQEVPKRTTKPVILMRMDEGDQLASVAAWD